MWFIVNNLNFLDFTGSMCLLNLSSGLGLDHWSFKGVIAFNEVHVLSIPNSKLSPKFKSPK